MIRFLVKSAFWLSIALFFIPLAPSSENGEPQVGALDALFAAQAALADVTGICERQPGVCEVGGQLVGSMGVRAREGARIAYEALDERFGDVQPESVLAQPSDAAPVYDETVLTGSVPAEETSTF